MRDKKPAILKDLIAPEHLLQAIDNSLMHCDETAHRVTGVHFEKYTITVHRRKGLSWYIECKFKPGPRRYDAEHDKANDSSRDRPEDRRKAN